MKFRKNLSLVLIFCLIFLTSLNLAHGANGFIIAIDDSSNIYYAKDNGDGTFSNYALIDHLGGSYARGVTINDFNIDGHMDFVAGRGVGSTAYLYLFLNDGSNNFTKSAMIGTVSNAGSYSMDMASGDFNNDGNMDFIANTNSATVGFFLGDGKGNFTKSESALVNNGRGMDVADFDHDGNLDFVRGIYNGSIYVYWGDGTGGFLQIFTLEIPDRTHTVLLPVISIMTEMTILLQMKEAEVLLIFGWVTETAPLHM